MVRLMVALLAPVRNVGETFVAATETSPPYVLESAKAKPTEKSFGATAVKDSTTGKVPALSATSPVELTESKRTRFGGSSLKLWVFPSWRILQVSLELEPLVTLARLKDTVAGIFDDLLDSTIVTSNS